MPTDPTWPEGAARAVLTEFGYDMRTWAGAQPGGGLDTIVALATEIARLRADRPARVAEAVAARTEKCVAVCDRLIAWAEQIGKTDSGNAQAWHVTAISLRDQIRALSHAGGSHD